ncbi:MAG: hypothetical protein K9L24_00485 [Spirochaetia bacterium]|nr:hypothetical protein [Spirochaetia bacterium]MCF7952569.1 hypothetical protein [Spirochaetales bacterium]
MYHVSIPIEDFDGFISGKKSNFEVEEVIPTLDLEEMDPNPFTEIDEAVAVFDYFGKSSNQLEKMPPLRLPISCKKRSIDSSRLDSVNKDKKEWGFNEELVKLSKDDWDWIEDEYLSFKRSVTAGFTFQDSIKTGWFPDFSVLEKERSKAFIPYHQIFPYAEPFEAEFEYKHVIIDDRYGFFSQDLTKSVQLIMVHKKKKREMFSGYLTVDAETGEVFYRIGPGSKYSASEEKKLMKIFASCRKSNPELLETIYQRSLQMKQYADYYRLHN